MKIAFLSEDYDAKYIIKTKSKENIIWQRNMIRLFHVMHNVALVFFLFRTYPKGNVFCCCSEMKNNSHKIVTLQPTYYIHFIITFSSCLIVFETTTLQGNVKFNKCKQIPNSIYIIWNTEIYRMHYKKHSLYIVLTRKFERS